MRKLLNFLIVLGIAVWVAFNLIDQPLDPDFSVYMADDSKPSHEQNGYLAFMGLAAPMGDDPHAYGVKQYEQVEKELAQSRLNISELMKSYGAIYESMEDITTADLLENAPPAEDRPQKPYEYDTARESLNCWTGPAIEVAEWKGDAEVELSCMTEADLSRHIAEIDVLLERYKALQKYPRFYELHPGISTPNVGFLSVYEYYMARNALLIKQGKSDIAMEHWLSSMQFIDSALRDQQTVVMKAILNIMLTQALDNLKLLLELDPTLAQRYQDKITAALTVGLHVDRVAVIKSVFRAEYQMTIGFLDRASDWTARLFFKKNATTNILVDHYRDLIDAASQPPADLIKSMKIIDERDKKRAGLEEGDWAMIDLLSYNMIGKLVMPAALMGESITIQFPWRYNAMRRMLILHVMAAVQNVTVADMPAFLGSAPENLYDPFTQKPFAWDPDKKTIFFIKADSYDSAYDQRQELSYP